MSNSHYYGLILAGGRGTRFWPRSRRANAKQVLEFFGEGTLIQQTVARLAPVLPPDRIWILTNHHLRDAIARQLPEVPKRQIIAEPIGRNTAPAIGLAAQIFTGLDPDAVLGVFPSDHYITRPSRFLRLVRPAFRAAAKGDLVVFGIQPRWAETGYGYIEFAPGARAGSISPTPVLSFREKPDQDTARSFVQAGRFYWNAGMFFGRASTFLEGLREHLPKTATLLSTLNAKNLSSRLPDVFPRCESISIDFALMEKARNVVGFAADDIGWNDVGSWNAVYELYKRDSHGNAVRDDVLFPDSSGNFVDAKGKTVVLLGVKDLIVIDTPDALLVADRNRAQGVAEVVKLLEKQKRDSVL